MKLFYYPAVASSSAERFLHSLQEEQLQAEIVALPGGCRLNSPLSLQLQNNDIMILFSAVPAELDELLSIREEFEDFRVILVTGSACESSCMAKIHQLRPRFVASAKDLPGLSAVVDKMLFHPKEMTTEPESC